MPSESHTSPCPFYSHIKRRACCGLAFLFTRKRRAPVLFEMFDSRVKHKRTDKQQRLITELRLSASDEFMESPPSTRQICCSTAVISEAVRLCVPVYGHVFANVCLYSLFQCSGLLLWYATAPQTTGLACVQQRFGFFLCFRVSPPFFFSGSRLNVA